MELVLNHTHDTKLNSTRTRETATVALMSRSARRNLLKIRRRTLLNPIEDATRNPIIPHTSNMIGMLLLKPSLPVAAPCACLIS
ncbi:hypothetical protein CFAEC_00445 [Corynebacterium faecale]|nr:hypothetical protein CFAEC_00445 [Corynebacterium faecale]